MRGQEGEEGICCQIWQQIAGQEGEEGSSICWQQIPSSPS